MSLEDLPGGWEVWTDEDGGRAVLVYEPTEFDSQAFPAPCLPTIYLTWGPANRRRPLGDRQSRSNTQWHVTLFLEPDVNAPVRTYESRPSAIEGALNLAMEFHRGEIDYRSLYQVPRESYLAKLDELTGSRD